MARDYAKSRPRRRGSNQAPRPSLGRWLFTVVVLLLFVCVLAWLWGRTPLHQQRPAPHKFAPLHRHPVVGEKRPVSKQPTQPSSPHFEFYTMLPKAHVEISERAMSGAASHQEQFALQVASVKDRQAADRLKAELSLLGYDVMVRQVQSGDTTWNRVEVGPYSSLKAAKGDQARLDKGNIKSILRKLS